MSGQVTALRYSKTAIFVSAERKRYGLGVDSWFPTRRGNVRAPGWDIDLARGVPYLCRMAVREIITIPDPLLRKVSEPVERIDTELLQLLDDMLATMYDAPGIGLAAVQIAVPRRVLVMDIAHKDEPKQPFFLINPQIVARSDALRCHEEGCLSIPDYYAEVERPASVTVQYVDRDGKQREEVFSDLLATVVQHEMDHLDGKQFIDYISKLKRDRVVRKLSKDRKRAAETAL